MEETPLDRAHEAMTLHPDDAAPRLRFFELLVAAEVFLLLDGRGEQEQPRANEEGANDEDADDTDGMDTHGEPQVFDIDGGSYVLAFDREHRLAQFCPGACYAALSGRSLVRLLCEKQFGVGLNLDVAPSSFLLPPEGVQWLARMVDLTPKQVSEVPVEFLPPSGISGDLISALDEKFAALAGLARAVWLISARYKSGETGLILAVIGVVDGAQSAFTEAVAEAVSFAPQDDITIDVAFFAPDAPQVERFRGVGLRFDLPEPQRPRSAAPGMDPDKPPKLRG